MAARIVNKVIHSPFPDFDVGNNCASELIKQRLSELSNEVIIADANQCLTACQMLAKIRRYGVGYEQHGVKPGSRVCAHIGNTIENVAAALGVVFAGGTLVMAKTSCVSRELLYTIEDSHCTFLIIDEQTAPNVKGLIMPPSLKELFAVGSVPGFINALKFQELSDASFKPHVPIDTEQEVVVVLYTSGSTGLPKGVEISHRAYCAAFLAFRSTGICTKEDVFLAWNPLTHVSGFAIGMFCMFLGAKIVITDSAIPCKDFLDTLRTFQVINLTSGEPVDAYQTGEIVVQSRSAMKSYFGRPEATAEALSSDGWLRTGDLGYYDLEGQIHIVDRLKQMIKCMGNVVTPAELENILMSHEDVAEAVVVGVPSFKYGEAPAACVVVKDGCERNLESLAEELKALIAGQAAAFKQLYGGVFFMKCLPKCINGKTMRQDIKKKISNIKKEMQTSGSCEIYESYVNQ